MSASQVHDQRKPEKPEKLKKLNIFINRKKFEVEADEMTPRQLLELAQESPEEVRPAAQGERPAEQVRGPR